MDGQGEGCWDWAEEEEETGREGGGRKRKNKERKEEEDEGLFVLMACCYTLINSAGSLIKPSPSEHTFSITNRAPPTSDLLPGSAASHLGATKELPEKKKSEKIGPDRQVNLRHTDRTNRSQHITPITEGVTLQQRPLQGKHLSLL